MDKINERFLQVMEYYNQTPSKFADELGVIRSSISHIISGRNKPGLDLIQKMLTTFPEVDADWLLLGKGKMIQPKEPEIKPTGAQLSLFDSLNPKTQENDKIKSHDKGKIGEKLDEPLINQPETFQQNNLETSSAKSLTAPASNGPIKRITVYYGDKSFQDFYPEVE